MKKMTKKTLATYRKMTDSLYDFMYKVIGNKTTYMVCIKRWSSTNGEYLSFTIAIADPYTRDYTTKKSFHKTFYSNTDSVQECIAMARLFVINNYLD